MTIGEAYKMWISAHTGRVRPPTIRAYKGTYKNHISAIMNNREIEEVSAAFAGDIFIQWKANCSRAVVFQIRKCLSALFSFLVEEKLVEKNYFIRIRIDKTLPKINILAKEEMKRLLDTAAAIDFKFYSLLLMLNTTGLRIGEALGIEWSDINFHDKTIYIQRQWTRGEFAELKTKSSARLIDISNSLSEVLEREKQSSQSKYVFANPQHGLPYGSSYVGKLTSEFLNELKLPHVNLHSFRHYHTTRLLENGVSLKAVQERMGWSSPIILLTRYAHVTRQEREKIVRLLNQAS